MLKKTPQTSEADQSTNEPRKTKQQVLIALLSRPEGATLAELATATEWQTHTVHGAMSGALKKRLGLAITSQKREGRGRVYQIAQPDIV